MSIRPRKQILNPDQLPLITPESSWRRPSELPALTGVGEIAIDTENKDEGLGSGLGPGWAVRAGYVCGVGVAWREGETKRKIYVPVRHPDTDNFPVDNVSRWLRDITRTRRCVFFNAGYDIGWLEAGLGVPPPPMIHDASAAAFLVDENRDEMSLDACCEWRGVPGKDTQKLKETAVVYGVRPQDAVANIWRFPARYVGEYGEQDPESTLDLLYSLRPELNEQGLLRAYATEMRLVPIIWAMRKRGIRVDIERAAQLRDGLRSRGDLALEKLGEHLGLRRAATLDEIRQRNWLLRMFEQEGQWYQKEEDEDGEEDASFNKSWMRRAEHWLPRLIAEAKQCHEVADKFLQKYLLDFAHRGRVHATINQWKMERGGTRSHRLSYADPPLQQAPSRGEPFDGWPLTAEIAKEYRMCFMPEDGQLWFAPDESQQEYRHIVADAARENLPRARAAAKLYHDDPNVDFHNLVVQWTGLGRRHAKDCNFAKAFGAGVPKFASMISKPVEEAAQIMGTYDEELPFVRELGKLCTRLAEQRGYIKLIDGARCHFDRWEAAWMPSEEWKRGRAEGWNMAPCSRDEAELRSRTEGHPWHRKRLRRAFTHKAMNRRIQGSSARQIKMAMVECGENVEIPLLQMHDELDFSLDDPRKGEQITDIMRTVYTCDVPFRVDAEWGTRWGNAKSTFDEAMAALRSEQ